LLDSIEAGAMANHFIEENLASRAALIGAAGAAILMFTTGLCAQTVVGGITPSQRPAAAPQIESVTRDAAWFRRALTGVSTPHPPSLRFLEDQGEWHTPFNRAGMTGPYDIRRWHRPSR
jgi:hypothetical protein